MQLDPQYHLVLRSMKSKGGLATLLSYAAPDERAISHARAASVRRLAQRLELAPTQVGELAEQSPGGAAKRFAPLTTLCGVNLLTAGTLAGILGPGHRFANDAELAARG